MKDSTKEQGGRRRLGRLRRILRLYVRCVVSLFPLVFCAAIVLAHDWAEQTADAIMEWTYGDDAELAKELVEWAENGGRT